MEEKVEETKAVEKNEGVSTKVLLKSGVWYTVCNFLFKTVTFLVAPFFSRILTKGEMGAFTNFTSWLLILSVFTAFDIQQSIILLKTEHEDDIDSFIFSILALTSVSNIIVMSIIMFNPVMFSRAFDVDSRYFVLMALYLFFTPAYQMFITKQRAYYKHKSFIVTTGICIVGSALLSLLFLLIMDNKLTARLWGNYIPFIGLGLVFYIYIVFKGKKIKLKYWKYSMALCLPLVPHVLSIFLLGSSDKIIVTKFSGAEITAMYGVAYMIYQIVGVLYDSFYKAWSPWLIENLHNDKRDTIKKASRYYVALFSIVVFGVLLLAPEGIFILGGSKYAGAEYCIPPMVASCFVQLMYSMYVNIEFFKKKTFMVSVATIISAVLNIILNLIFVPIWPSYGHIVAAYTSLAGYLVLFAIHFIMVKRMHMTDVYDTKYNVFAVAVVIMISLLTNILYRHIVVRYLIILCVAIGFIFIVIKLIKNKDTLKEKFKNM